MLYQVKEILKKIIPNFLIDKYHLVLAFLAALLHRFPSNKLTVIGVTGTKGKTTTCYLIYQLLNLAGLKTGLTSSVFFGDGERVWLNETKHGMPGRFLLQKLLAQIKKAGCRYAVIETTSEGILQHRHRFIDYKSAVFTNLAPEHLERHGSFENYRAAKLELFEKLSKKENGIAVYNLDDEHADFFLQPAIKNKYGYKISSKLKAFTRPNFQGKLGRARSSKPQLKTQSLKVIQIIEQELKITGTSFKIGETEFNSSLIGEFNLYNLAAAICVALSQGVAMEKIKELLPKLKPVPGRLELIDEGQDFKVIIDYAHEPLSLQAAYKTARLFEPRKMICLLGSQGGGRDKWKRPKMGELTAKYCDAVILTNEDPYDENPLKIIEEIEKGFSSTTNYQLLTTNYWKILDRRAAIRKALSLAQKDDLVILTGKAGEVWMCVEKGKKIPWDEREVVRLELQKLIIAHRPELYSDNSDGYEVLEHTADLKIMAFGQDKKELFLNAMRGMFEAAQYETEGKQEIKRAIKISSFDLTSLLVDFLSEVLYFCETHKEVYDNIVFEKFSDKKIKGILIGKKLKRMAAQIKGVTYHDLEIKQKKDSTWQATVLFDI